MAKDWESFKKEYLQAQLDHLNWKLGNLERDMKSPIERIMFVTLHDEFDWAIDQESMEILMQKKIGKYTVDFYVSYKASNGKFLEFIVECDGHDYHERTKAQATHDKKRDRFFTEKGYIVLRYTGSEIVKDYQNISRPLYAIILQNDGVTGCG